MTAEWYAAFFETTLGIYLVAIVLIILIMIFGGRGK